MPKHGEIESMWRNIDENLVALERGLETITQALAHITQTLADIDSRLDAIDARLSEHTDLLHQILAKLPH